MVTLGYGNPDTGQSSGKQRVYMTTVVNTNTSNGSPDKFGMGTITIAYQPQTITTNSIVKSITLSNQKIQAAAISSILTIWDPNTTLIMPTTEPMSNFTEYVEIEFDGVPCKIPCRKVT